MTTPQLLSVAVIATLLALFVWGRLRYDLVAALGLVGAVALGLVPTERAFSGFGDDIVIVVASALVISAAIGRSGLLDRALRLAAPFARTVQSQVVLLVIAATLLSAFIKNVGALAMLIPLAFQVARRSNVSPSLFLMPMAFGALLGGITTLVGTSPNIVVARVRGEITGQPFGMFDFAPVGIAVALAGVAFLAVGYRLIPADRRGAASLGEALDIRDYVTEARVPPGPAAVRTIAALQDMADGEVTVTALVRGDAKVASPRPDEPLQPGDIVLLEGEPDALERLVVEAELELEARGRGAEPDDPAGEIGVVEAVIGPNSPLVRQSARGLDLRGRMGLNLLAVSRSNRRLTDRLRDLRLRAGDVVALQGVLTQMPERLAQLGLLPLVERKIHLGGERRGWLAVSILAVTVALVATSLVPVAIAFFGAAMLMVATGALPMREAYDSVEWPILIMLAALIPVSDALRTTGTTDVLAAWLSGVAGGLPHWGALALIMVAAMAVTPFLNNAATVLVMAPIAAGFAKGLGYRPDPFLMAVAIGAACDFLTPIGHQCNTLVMGPGGYQFGDYARLGLPLSLIVVVIGVPLLLLVWPAR